MVEGFLLSALAMIRWIRNIAVRLRSFHHKLFPVYVWTYVNIWTKKVESSRGFFKSLIFFLLGCHIVNCTVKPFSVIPGFYILENCPPGFLSVFVCMWKNSSGLLHIQAGVSYGLYSQFCRRRSCVGITDRLTAGYQCKKGK